MEWAEAVEFAPSHLDFPNNGEDLMVLRLGSKLPYVRHSSGERGLDHTHWVTLGRVVSLLVGG